VRVFAIFAKSSQEFPGSAGGRRPSARGSARSVRRQRILMSFRPPHFHHSHRGSSNSGNLSSLSVIISVLLASSSSSSCCCSWWCWSSPSSRVTAFSSLASHFSTSSSRLHRSTSPPLATTTTTTSSRFLVALEAVGSDTSNGENTDSMTSTPPTISIYGSAINNAVDATIIPGIASRTLHNLVEYATSFSAANGLQVEQLRDSTTTSNNNNNNNNHGGYITAPISLLPQSYPASQFRRATLLAAPFNILVDRISNDGIFLKKTLRDVRDVDVYTGKLLDLYEEIYLGKSCISSSSSRSRCSGNCRWFL
jgi:hypothetical protein